MKTTACVRTLLPLILFLSTLTRGFAQAPSPVAHIFPPGTVTYRNINYAGDTLRQHLLDIYLPPDAKPDTPLIIWIHGGAWMLNDKYADMGYMKNTIRGFIESGYALASIDYRYSTVAAFPAQIQDCNQALQYLYAHAGEYKLDRNRIALIGFSAGGHLASLLALSRNNRVKEFYANGTKNRFKIKCVLDFYGPSDLIAIASSPDTSINNTRHPVSILLGALPVERPDLARLASPVSYIDKNDPPFLIVQGEKDESVPNTQSRMLSAWLNLSGVTNELIMVPGAPHYGVMFDEEWIRQRLMQFLARYLN
jgi:acetyl esterase/lipase